MSRPIWDGTAWDLRLVYQGFEDLVIDPKKPATFELESNSKTDPAYFTVKKASNLDPCWATCRFFELGFIPLEGTKVPPVDYGGGEIEYQEAGDKACNEFGGKWQIFFRLISNIKLRDGKRGTITLFQVPDKVVFSNKAAGQDKEVPAGNEVPKDKGADQATQADVDRDKTRRRPLLVVAVDANDSPNGSAVGRPRDPA